MSRTAIKNPKTPKSGGLYLAGPGSPHRLGDQRRSSKINVPAPGLDNGSGAQEYRQGAGATVAGAGLIVLSGYTPRTAEILQCGAPLTFQILLTFGRTVYSVDGGLLNTFVGRNPKCKIHVSTEFTSRVHACFSVREDGIHLLDNSRNGTVVRTDAGEVFYLRNNLGFPMIGSGVISFGCSIPDAGSRLVQYACKPC